MELIKKGKVRDIFYYKSYPSYLLLYHSDRLSSFDSYICNINGKGNSLMLLSIWWMNQTKNIIKNHYINHYKNYMLVKKCIVIPIEFVVRGYITGSTNTSLWTHYKNGTRNYCGIDLPDCLLKNQKLETPILTPTTKSDEHDELISCDEIIKRQILTEEQFKYLEKKALELFKYGQEIADSKGLILVDTKYEFGIDIKGELILVDEIHTGDSSRYWLKKSYQSLFEMNQEPNKIDKDSVRDYIKSVCPDPYNNPIPSESEIPPNIKTKVIEGYNTLYQKITGYHLNTEHNLGNLKNLTDHTYIDLLYHNLTDKLIVVILSGSNSDNEHVSKIEHHLDKFNICNESYVISAHKNTSKLLNTLDSYNKLQYIKIVYITVAGRSNALSGVVACNTNYPVIACPPFKDNLDMMININSTLQCPSKVPVLTVLEPENVAISCQRILMM